MAEFSNVYGENLYNVNCLLRVKESFDIIIKRIKIAGRYATFYGINGFVKDEIIEKILDHLTKITQNEFSSVKNADDFINSYITYYETNSQKDINSFITQILSGSCGLVVEGFDKGIVLDCRTYPARNVQEPESDKVLRGSHEGFVETVIFNTALIRRKIKSPELTLKSFQVGSESKTDVVVCYLENSVDKRKLMILTEKLKKLSVKSLPMSHESLKECIMPYQPWNPFPKVRYTERPDCAAACIYDGNIIVLTDGSPSAMIIPTGIFDFVQDINDYYFPPFIGSFIRFIRISVFALSMFFIPIWYLITEYHTSLPAFLKFMLVEDPNGVPIIAQLLIVEFVIDTLRLASLNTPSALSNSFSVVGALVLGEFAVRSGWFVPEVVLFMAFVAISNFTQPSFELGYAIKLARTLILILCGIFKIWGFVFGLLIVTIVVATTKTLDGYTYLYPLIPFNKAAFRSLLTRRHKMKSEGIK